MVSKENYRSLIRCIGWFGLIIPMLRNITQVVRILPPPRAWIHTRLGHAKPQYFADPARLEKRLEFGKRDAKCNAAGAMHRVAWALQTAKGTSPKCGKPWENQGF